MLIKNQFNVCLCAPMQILPYNRLKHMLLIITMCAFRNALYLILLIYLLKDACLIARIHTITMSQITLASSAVLSVSPVQHMTLALAAFQASSYKMDYVYHSAQTDTMRT